MLFSPSFSFFNFPHVYMIPNLLHGSLPQKPQSSFSLFFMLFFLTPLLAMVTLSDPAHISLITLVHNVYVRELVHENGVKGSLNAFFYTAHQLSSTCKNMEVEASRIKKIVKVSSDKSDKAALFFIQNSA